MVRAVIVLLLLAIFFLSGTLYGMNQSTKGSGVQNAVEEDKLVNPEPQEVDRVQEAVPASIDEDLMAIDNQVHFTQKTASFLESSVQGFYEVVVSILYELAELFF